MLGVQAVYLIFFRLRTTQKSINRRLELSKQLSGTATVLDALRRERGFSDSASPTLNRLNDQLTQTGLTINRTVLALSIPGLAVVFFVAFGVTLGYGVSALV